MNELFEKVGPTFSKFQNEKDIEIELRLGKINRGSFDTNVGQHTFEKILQGLHKCAEAGRGTEISHGPGAKLLSELTSEPLRKIERVGEFFSRPWAAGCGR